MVIVCDVCVCTQMKKSRAVQPAVETEDEEQRQGDKAKAKWSPEEVSGGFMTNFSFLIFAPHE